MDYADGGDLAKKIK